MRSFNQLLRLFRPKGSGPDLSTETGEREAFFGLCSAVGSLTSFALGMAVRAFSGCDTAGLVVTALSLRIARPAFRLVAFMLWRRLARTRACSPDIMDRLLYLKDEYHDDIREIMALNVSQDKKAKIAVCRLEMHLQERARLREIASDRRLGSAPADAQSVKRIS
jgi:hypothetical protein